MPKKLYRPTSSDSAIFEAARHDPNLFSNYYIRTPYTTGTYYRPPVELELTTQVEWIRTKIESRRAISRNAYRTLQEVYDSLGRPEHFLKDGEGSWSACNRIDFERISDSLSQPVYRVTDAGDHPTFFRHHGFLFQPWQKQFASSPESQLVVVGGYGSGKSVTALIQMLIWAVTLRGFRGAIIAPYAVQVKKNYQDALSFLRGSLYDKRFVLNYRNAPPQEITVGTEETGENTIIFLPALDDPEKVKNIEVDAVIIEQAEQFENILAPDTGLLSMVTSRVRGFDFQSGRERLGKCMWIANSSSNPELWGLVDKHEIEPDVFRFFQISSLENIYITENQIRTWLATFATNEEDAEVSLNGGKPMGAGKEFSRDAVEQCRSREMDQYMQYGLDAKLPGFVRESTSGVGIYRWELPYESDGIYAVFADPGWGNPPGRNAPAMAVLRIDGFPERPAEVAAFRWVFGKGKPQSWIDSFIELHDKYRVIPGYSAYDATGPQSGYAHMNVPLAALGAYEVSMSGVKDMYLTFLRMMLNRQFLLFPYELMSWTRQLTEYEQPDKDLAQDIVMMLVVAAAWLQPKYNVFTRELNQEDLHRFWMDTPVPRQMHRHARTIATRAARGVPR